MIGPGGKGTCPVCHRTITVGRGGRLRRHKGVTEFDRSTDDICSGANGGPVENGGQA